MAWSGSQEDRPEPASIYDGFTKPGAISLGVATLLFLVTIGLMLAFRGTIFAHAVIALFSFSPLLGAVAFGLLLTVGYHVGIQASTRERYPRAVAGMAMIAFLYGAFGAAVLSFYSVELHATALALTAAATAGISLGAGWIVYTTSYSFEAWGRYASILMAIGLTALFAFTFYPWTLLLYIAFGAILVGWIVALFYEIHMLSDEARSPIANGIGLYVAFTGTYVHILQLVLRYLRR